MSGNIGDPAAAAATAAAAAAAASSSTSPLMECTTAASSSLMNAQQLAAAMGGGMSPSPQSLQMVPNSTTSQTSLLNLNLNGSFRFVVFSPLLPSCMVHRSVLSTFKFK